VAEQGTIQVEILSIDAAVVSLHGEHDLESQARVATALAAAGTSRTVFADLSACTFADSSVITALLRAARAMEDRGGTLELVVAPEARTIRRTLEIMGLVGILTVHDSLAETIAGQPRRAELRRAA
jgi:anti-anti-sigma factor